MVESFATINHKLGDKSLWRKASIIADATLGLVTEADDYTGHALIDEVLATPRYLVAIHNS